MKRTLVVLLVFGAVLGALAAALHVHLRFGRQW